ncbi:dihydrolipoyl dehydrogenase family protein [Candidatus Palauibacter sp.]|uniref:dihydrolipoyl dehydrogenase family protein n=1 Tax=Candidatus Palauibacter sp. TaxID=3101350 RepID=UPI003B01D322
MARDQMFDIVAIGGGTAGLVTAAGSAGLGASVALIERDRLGGDCLWTGCVPSKALISSARVAHHFRDAAAHGLRPVQPQIEGADVLASVRAARAEIEPHDDPERFRAMGVDVVEGAARFVSPHEVEVDGRRIRARRFVVASGSRAAVPPIPGLEEAGYFTHAEAFDRDTIPASLAVVGGGPIGVELAQAFRRLGSEVTVVELLNRLMVREEPELAELLTSRLRGEGIEIRTGHVVTRVDRAGDRRRVTIAAAGDAVGDHPAAAPETSEVDEVLVAAGRAPNTEDMGLDAAGVETAKGWVTVDSKLRTSRKHIFAAGDVIGGFLFTHVADHEARTVVQNALFPVRANIDYGVIPWCTYTEPELAHVGLTEAEAEDRHGSAVSAHVYDIGNLDRAIAERAAIGRVKIVVGKGGRILGGHILAPGAGTMIAEISLAMKAGVKLGTLGSLVHPYPTMSEGVKRTADAYRRSTLTGWRKSAVDLALRVGRRLPP